MKLSCADFTFPLLSHENALALIRMLDIEGVDLGVFAGRSHLQPKDVVERPAASAAELKSALGRHGLALADVFLQTGESPAQNAANSPDPAERRAARETFLRVLEFAASADAGHLSGLPGVFFEGVPRSDSLKLSAEECAWRVAEARKAGLCYAVEPHVGSIAPTPEAALELLGLSEGLTLTLDYGHFIHAGCTNEDIHPLLARASHFHARGGAKGRLQTTVAENAIDFRGIVERFDALGYAGWLCLEYVWIDWEGCNRTDNVSETIRLRDLLRQCSAGRVVFRS